MAGHELIRYPAPLRAIHWLTAVVVLIGWPLGYVLDDLPSGAIQNFGYNFHRSLGTLVLALAIVRVIARLAFGAPRPLAGLPQWQVTAAKAVHWALYVLLFAVPIAGWAATSAFGARISVFGLFILPPLIAKDRELAGTLFEIHGFLAFALAAVFVVHVGAALHHRFVKRDGVLARML